jgi:hypothetical protein
MRGEARSVRRYAFCMHATAVGCTCADSAIVARDALRGLFALRALSRQSGRGVAGRAASPGEGEGRGASPRRGRSCQCSYLQYLVVAKVWLNPLWAELLGRAHACIRRVPFTSGFGAIPAIANGVVSSFRSP